MFRARLLTRSAPAALVAACAVAACIANAPSGIQRQTDSDGGGGGFPTQATDSATSGLNNNDPHAVLGANPPHGSFRGGERVIIVGRGFTPSVQVWFGATAADNIVAIDPTRVQVNAPPGSPGSVDIRAQNGDDESTQRSLPAGYSYDALYAEPDSGPVAGGTVVRIVGAAGHWDADLEQAWIDNQPCTTVSVISASELSCVAPKGTPGTKSIAVTTAAEGTVTALDAYTYQDSANGFKGGLSGAQLNGELRVLAYDNFSGDPLVGAHVIAGDNLTTGIYQQADATGVAQLSDASLTQPTTVTVAAHCHSPITFVAVPVDTVTVYLDPVLKPGCGQGGDPPPPGGGNPTTVGFVEGELVWPEDQEFQKGTWSNVPGPDAGEVRIAYLFTATSDPAVDFSTASAIGEVTELSPGDFGYGFDINLAPGNHALYAIAGLRNTQTGQFAGYAFGAVHGVAVLPSEVTTTVVLHMDHVFDQALTVAPAPPAPASKGPDRLQAATAVEILHNRFAILPAAQQSQLLPLNGNLFFVGLPPLDGGLTGMRYVASAAAVTGPSRTAPLSVVANVATTTTSAPLVIDGYVAIPTLTTPAAGIAFNGTDLAVNYQQGGFPPDLTVYEVLSGSGLWRWVIAVPAADHAITVPDLSGFVDAHLPSGPIVIAVYGARLDAFDYGTIGFGNLRPGGMDAYALDFFNSFQ